MKECIFRFTAYFSDNGVGLTREIVIDDEVICSSFDPEYYLLSGAGPDFSKKYGKIIAAMQFADMFGSNIDQIKDCTNFRAEFYQGDYERLMAGEDCPAKSWYEEKNRIEDPWLDDDWIL